MSGLEATARVTAAHPDVAVVVLTMDADDDSVFAARASGADPPVAGVRRR